MSFSFLAFIICCTVLFTSCRKINEATELGSDLVPEVDNVNTFEKIFETETGNFLLNDTARLNFNDQVALGHIGADPEFGQTTANVYFSVSAPSYGTFPFRSKDNIAIDSVVLSLSYTGSYGDVNSIQTVRVYELPQTSDFADTVRYRYIDPEFETGIELGTKSFAINSLKDSIRLVHGRDTIRTANVLRIHLNTNLGERLASFDTARNANGGYYNDSLFKTLFKGLAVKAQQGSGNGLAYFNLTDPAKTNITVYYRIDGSTKDTARAVFSHTRNGQANIISRIPGGNYAANLSNGTAEDELLYIQSTPGSYASIRIPELDNFENSAIHRAELIVTRVPSTLDNIFTPPAQLFLDKLSANGDTAYALEKDFQLGQGLNANWEQFGGNLRRDGSYRFNITGHVQDIITRDSSNRTLRLYAPVETTILSNQRVAGSANTLGNVIIAVLPRAADGRVVVGGGNHPDPNVRMRLRIVYSKL